MASLSRRAFLARSSMVAAAAGAASAIPGLTSVFGAAQTEAPAVEGAVADTATLEAADAGIGAADSAVPLVAHVRDLSTGEIAVFNGTREVIVRDPQLANNLFRAAR
jgi:hypothetical protein